MAVRPSSMILIASSSCSSFCDESDQVVGLLEEHGLGLLAGLLGRPPEEVDGRDLHPHVLVVGLLVLRLLEVGQGGRELARLEERQGELAEGLAVLGIEVDGVLVLEHRFPVLLLAEVTVSAVQMARAPNGPGPPAARDGKGEREAESERPLLLHRISLLQAGTPSRRRNTS
jgi:hypothetical protein